MMLALVSFEQFDREWSFYESCMLRVKALRGGTWEPRHIYADVRQGFAEVYAVPEGFIVVRFEKDAYSYEKVFLIWLAYGDEDSKDNLFDKYEGELIKTAKARGFDKMKFYRAPTLRVREQHQPGKWRREYSVYELDLNEAA